MHLKTKENFGIYIHFPFCRRKCIYCDFYSVGEKLADWESFARAVENEFYSRVIVGEGSDKMNSILTENRVASLYLGGGTPSLAPPSVIRRFREMIPYTVGEFTMEVNPDDVTDEKARAWREGGVNRISMGVQSLCDAELHLIGRRHSARQARQAYAILRKYFDNISLDLIFGLPGQNSLSLEQTISGFLEMRPEHISAYSLMYEERTALTRLRDTGHLEEVGEDDSVEMFRFLSKRLREAGYERYEISNYSLPGFRSHHNSNYWRGVPYIGLGPSAHSYDGRDIRQYNRADLSLYIKRWGAQKQATEGKKPEDKDSVIEVEKLSEEELREEMLLTRLRTVEGLDLNEYRNSFGDEEYKILLHKAETFIRSSILHHPSPENLALTEKGVMISDEVIASLF